jgi:transcription antitermination factor NusG
VLIKEEIVLKNIPGFIWMPVRTKPRREKKVAEYCQANGIEYYLPLKRNVHRYERRTVEFRVPMFPGYVFCSLNEASYQTLLRSNAIVYRITIDEVEERSLLEELKAIRAFEELANKSEVEVKPELVKGTKVVIQAGPMKGMQGIIERRKGKTLMSVNIEILGQSATAEVDVGDLEADD